MRAASQSYRRFYPFRLFVQNLKRWNARLATPELVDWLNHRLLEPTGNMPPAEADDLSGSSTAATVSPEANNKVCQFNSV